MSQSPPSPPSLSNRLDVLDTQAASPGSDPDSPAQAAPTPAPCNLNLRQALGMESERLFERSIAEVQSGEDTDSADDAEVGDMVCEAQAAPGVEVMSTNAGASDEGEAEGQAEGEDEGEESDDGEMGESPVHASHKLKLEPTDGDAGPAGIRQKEEVGSPHSSVVQQLVPFEAAEAVMPGASPSQSWQALPPEAHQEWRAAGELCELTVGGRTVQLPRSIYSKLYRYQRQGVTWMLNLFHKEHGGILADEMGLGKTVQAAACMAALKMTNAAQRFLVVAPPTLLEQWKCEITTWGGDAGLAVHVYHGDQRQRKAALRGMLVKGGAMLITYDLVVTGISHFKAANLEKAVAAAPKKRRRVQRSVRDDDDPSEEDEPLPDAPAPGSPDMPWDLVIVDEAHNIKNPASVCGRALRRVLSKCRILLTGTPLQNKLSDLWALMDFAHPGLLGNHQTFVSCFSEPIAKGSKRNADQFAVEVKENLAKELRRMTAPHFLRRMKAEVQSHHQIPGTASLPDGTMQKLPSKTEIVLWLNLTHAQRELYQLCLHSELVRRATGTSKCGMEALRAIALLKKLCNHPYLCLPQQEFEDWRESVQKLLQNPSKSSESRAAPLPEADDEGDTQPAVECQQMLPRLRALISNTTQTASLLSCKLRVLEVLLVQLQKRGHRCLIFSHSTRMLDLIQMCVLRPRKLVFLRVDGSVEPKIRDVKIAKFEKPGAKYFCMCLSSQVGGVGLTLTSADRVILMDPAWNPAMDAQAVDRVHRIGQTKDVVVYRLICAGALEDKMFRLQIYKQGLTKTALELERQMRLFTNEELKKLFEPLGDPADHEHTTQAIMAQQLGNEAREHPYLVTKVTADIGTPEDPDEAAIFWQSSDVTGFSDYHRLFMYPEQLSHEVDATAEAKALELATNLSREEYVKDQVITGKWQAKWQESKENQENACPQNMELVPLPDVCS